MDVIVVGGSGFIGRHLVKELLNRGHSVRVLSRSSPASPLPDGVAHFKGDVSTAEHVAEAAAGCQAIAFLAGREDAPWLPRGDRDGSAMFEVNVRGTSKTLSAAREAGVQHAVVLTSSLTFGIGRDGEPVDGTEPVGVLGLRSPYVLSRLQQEHAAFDTVRPEFRVTCLAPSAVVGPGDTKMFGPFARATSTGWPMMIPRGGFNFIAIDDVAAGVANVIEGRGGRSRYLLANENLTYQEVSDIIASADGRSPIRMPLPPLAGRAAMSLVSLGSTLMGRRLGLTEAKYFLNHRVFYDARLAVSEIGLPQTSVREAVLTAIDHMRNDD